MPLSYTVDLDRGYVHVRGWGDLVGADLKEHLHELVSETDLPQPYRQLCDLRNVENFELQADDARYAISVLGGRQEIRGGRLAMVTSRSAVYGMCRMFGALADGAFGVGVFSNLAQAEAFLLGDVRPTE